MVMDKLTPEQRKKNMRSIRGKDTSIEMILRKALWKKGYHYRIPHEASVYYTADQRLLHQQLSKAEH